MKKRLDTKDNYFMIMLCKTGFRGKSIEAKSKLVIARHSTGEGKERL